MPGEGEETARLRKPRFSYEENRILIQEVRAHYGRLYGSQSRRVTVAERRRVWEGIAAKINRITSWRRTGQEVQKRWNDFKRRTKEKLARVPHSTQGGGTGTEEAFSAEEETLFAILAPGAAGTTEAGRDAHSCRLAAEHGADMLARGNTSCSPETSARAPCCTLESGLLRPKERDSLAPTPGQPSSLQIVQLAPSPASAGCRPHPGHSPAEPLAAPCPSTSPPLRRRRTRLDVGPEPSLDFLQAQRETAEAIRQLTHTLRQGLERLTDIVAALLPLLPVQADALLHQQGATSDPVPAPSTEAPTDRDPFVAKVEPGPDAERPPQEEGGPAAETRPSPSQAAAPQKRRKGVPTQKRRGRWKNL
ncbi:UNVERIFIED_CONTAM: hypothetical protein K2H54_034802 [Gekko kuhli]